jgi:AmmeMemoRadiSam system radical SAM enzyme/AmmeMemoRadiSam system protein B/AmmeMemoRadiSam system protein A
MKSRVANEPLADLMDRHTAISAPELCRVEGKHLRCLACGHRCLIGEGLRGICKVRYNEGGQLKVPFGYVSGVQCDPVEKKPFFHVFPGSDALTFGMLGCDLHCSYCQNWLTSQALRDEKSVAPIRPVTPAQLTDVARRQQARLVVSSYNEPLITAEWAVSVFREAGAAGLACAFVSNGNATPEVLDYLRPWIVAYKIDLKGFTEASYRTLGGTLENVLRSIRMVYERGLWIEIVTLIIPGFNDSEDELRQAARFLVSVSPDIPWHVTAFHQDYKMTDPEATPAETLIRAAEIGSVEGLRYVYAGNLPGRVGPWENTRCPSCRATLIERYGYLIRSYHLTPTGQCQFCGKQIPGVWPRSAAEVKMGNDAAAYQSRLPRALPVAEDRKLMPLPSVSSKGGTQAMPTPSIQPPGLTDAQRERIIACAAGLVRSSVCRQPGSTANLEELREHPVAGVFISLKRGRHLRSCCGMLGQPIPLFQALEHAAERVVWDDARFPPISLTELPHLDMEVWLLTNLQPVAARGVERMAAITIGKHGIKIVQGASSALFLPSVAVENQWSVERYLDQVCLKAGLPPTTWRDDTSNLFTFEGEALHGRPADAAETPARRPGPCRPEEVQTYADYGRVNLTLLLTGRMPSLYIPAPDGNVNGLVLSVHRPDALESQQFSQLSLRHGLPLQSTLFNLTQTAAQQLAKEGMAPQTLSAVRVGVMLLHDPVLHGTVADPHLDGFDPRHRAVLILERNKTAVLYDPARTAEELVASAAEQARVSEPGIAAIFSLDTLTNATSFGVATLPKAVRGPAVRQPAVAGQFYEANPEQLSRTVDQLLSGERRPEPWPAALVPHAGLKFSGALAAAVLRRLQIPRTVIVIGPKHTPQGMDWAVAPQQTWALPGGSVESDFMLARQLCQAIPGLEMDAAAHQGEHAIEVELPLLARLAPETRVVGIAIGHATLEDCRRFAAGLANLLRERDEQPLLLISSDMNHFATDVETRRLDALALAALERGDAGELYETVMRHSISMCGVLPAIIVLETLRFLGNRPRGERVGYATTADVTGDKRRVVGYAGMLFGSGN